MQVRRSVICISLKIFHRLLWSTLSKALAYSMRQSPSLRNFLDFSMIQRILAIWSLFSLSFINPTWISESYRLTSRWSLAWRILRIIFLVCEMSEIVWYFQHSLALPFFGIGNESSPFLVLWQLLSFPNLLACWGQHLNCTFLIF